MAPKSSKEKLVIIDANSVIHRAYHALPRLSTRDGKLVNAVYGFLLVFLKVVNELHPDCLATAFDLPAPTFRHKKYKEYKATRPKAPPELYAQIPLVKEILQAFGVQVFEKEGFEADDIIGTISDRSKEESPGILTTIVSGDSDSLQLVDNNARVYILRKGVKDVVLYDTEMVKEKFQGILPSQLVDYKALRGDSSDNVPGVPQIGEKTAESLILRFGNLENLYKELKKKKDIDGVSQKLKELLLKNEKEAFFSRELVKLDRRVPIKFSLDDCGWPKYDKEKIKKLLENFEFHTLVKRLDDLGQEKQEPKEQKKNTQTALF